MHLNIRYQYGLISIWDGDDDDLLITRDKRVQSTDQRSSLISIRAIWVFGEKESKAVREGTL